MSGQHMDRRTVIRSAGVLGAGAVGAGALAACGGSGTTQTPPAAQTPAGSGSTSASGSATGAPAGGTVKVADVPVGGGTILADQKVVVTQPAAGQFKAFSAVCTHMGCTVNKIAGGVIQCPCHQSEFDVSTGAPTAGSPAKTPLAGKTATVSGDTIVIT